MKTILLIFLVAFFSASRLAMAQREDVTKLMEYYYGVKNALVADSGGVASEQAHLLLNAVKSLKGLSAKQAEVWNANKDVLIAESEAIANASHLSDQRGHLNDLSVALYAVLRSFNVEDHTVYYQYCPMKQAYWLSSDKKIRNPYFGKRMLTCGSIQDTLK